MNLLQKLLTKKRKKTLTGKVEIKTGMFCTVETSDYCKYGVKRGNLIYVYGEFMSRLDKDDPYAFRKLFLGVKTRERHVTEFEKPFTIDGANLKSVKKTAQERLEKLLEDDYAAKE